MFVYFLYIKQYAAKNTQKELLMSKPIPNKKWPSNFSRNGLVGWILWHINPRNGWSFYVELECESDPRLIKCKIMIIILFICFLKNKKIAMDLRV